MTPNTWTVVGIVGEDPVKRRGRLLVALRQGDREARVMLLPASGKWEPVEVRLTSHTDSRQWAQELEGWNPPKRWAPLTTASLNAGRVLPDALLAITQAVGPTISRQPRSDRHVLKLSTGDSIAFFRPSDIRKAEDQIHAAMAYEEAFREGRPPVEAAQAELLRRGSNADAKGVLLMARRAGFLTSAGKRIAGGHVTDYGRAVLAAIETYNGDEGAQK
ncbi:MAG: hypothetical protein AB7I24_05770 [Candidatus Nanopelagicales bacterium]